MDSPIRLGYWREPATRVPPPAEAIWRYMDLGKFVSMLANEALYFPLVASLGKDDPMEAVPPVLPAASTDDERDLATSSWAMCRFIYFVNCWHCSPVESAAMWKIYAGRNEGIAIKSTFGLLSTAFPAASEEDLGQLVRAGLVEYIPDREEQSPRQLDLDAQVLRKREWYSYEKELRLIFSIPNNMIRTKDGPSFQHSGIWVPCDLKRVIESVVVAPGSPPYLEFAVGEVLRLFKFEPELLKPSRLVESALDHAAEIARFARPSSA